MLFIIHHSFLPVQTDPGPGPSALIHLPFGMLLSLLLRHQTTDRKTWPDPHYISFRSHYTHFVLDSSLPSLGDLQTRLTSPAIAVRSDFSFTRSNSSENKPTIHPSPHPWLNQNMENTTDTYNPSIHYYYPSRAE